MMFMMHMRWPSVEGMNNVKLFNWRTFFCYIQELGKREDVKRKGCMGVLGKRLSSWISSTLINDLKKSTNNYNKFNLQ